MPLFRQIRNGTILSWNHGAQRLFGYARDEMVGQPLTMLMPARYRGPCLDGLNRVVDDGSAASHGENARSARTYQGGR